MQQVAFDDGTTWDLARLVARSTLGTTGDDDDVLCGNFGNDTLIGGAGNDYLDGGAGSNTYLFGRGDGVDQIRGEDANPGKLSTLRFKPGVAASDIVVKRQGERLSLGIAGTGDRVDIPFFFYQGSPNSTRTPVQQLKFDDGTTWDLATLIAKSTMGGPGNDTPYGSPANTLLESQVQNLVQAMASFSPPAAGQTTLAPSYQSTLNTVLATNWQ